MARDQPSRRSPGEPGLPAGRKCVKPRPAGSGGAALGGRAEGLPGEPRLRREKGGK